MTARTWIREHLLTAEAIYGLILYSALIAGVSHDDSNAVEVLLISGASLLIFWGAHIFAQTLAAHGAEKKLSVAIGHALANSSGMLYASLLPSVPLILGAFSLMRTDDAVTLSLLIAMIVLGALGYNALGERGKHPVLRVLGAIGTAFFGFLVIVLNTAVH